MKASSKQRKGALKTSPLCHIFLCISLKVVSHIIHIINSNIIMFNDTALVAVTYVAVIVIAVAAS